MAHTEIRQCAGNDEQCEKHQTQPELPHPLSLFPIAEIVPFCGPAEIFSAATAHIPCWGELPPDVCLALMKVFRQVPTTVVTEISLRRIRKAARRQPCDLGIKRFHPGFLRT